MRLRHPPAQRQDRTPLVAFLLLLALCLSVVGLMIAPYLLSLFMGATLALVSDPFYARLLRAGWRPRWAALAVTAAVIVLIVAPLSTLAVLSVRQAVGMAQGLSQQEGLTLQELTERVSRWPPVRAVVGDAGDLRAQVREGLQGAGRVATAVVVRLAKGIPVFLLQAALASLACFFFLVDGRRFVGWMLRRSPLDHDVRHRLVQAFTDMTVSTVWAGLAAATSQALVLLTAFLMLGVPGAFLAGGATFVLSWIPILGSPPVALSGFLYLLLDGSPGKAAVMAAFGATAGVIDNVVRPWVLKGRSDLHPFVGLVAIIGGMHMFGIVGVLIGPVLATLLVALLEVWPSVASRFGLTFDSNGHR